jgi:hypothetical protein
MIIDRFLHPMNTLGFFELTPFEKWFLSEFKQMMQKNRLISKTS